MDEKHLVPTAQPADRARRGRARALGWGGLGIALAVQTGVLWVAQGRGGESAPLLAGTGAVSLGLAVVAWVLAFVPRRPAVAETKVRAALPGGGGAELPAVFEALPVGVVVTDREGLICLWNEGARAITGFGAREVLGLPRGALFVEKMRPAAAPGRSHCPLRRKGGGWVVARVWAAPVAASAEGRARRVEVFVEAAVERPASQARPKEAVRPLQVAAPQAEIDRRPAAFGAEILGPLGRVVALARALGEGPLFPEEAAAARAILDEVSRLQRRLAPGGEGEPPREDPDGALRALVEGLDRL